MVEMGNRNDDFEIPEQLAMSEPAQVDVAWVLDASEKLLRATQLKPDLLNSILPAAVICKVFESTAAMVKLEPTVTDVSYSCRC